MPLAGFLAEHDIVVNCVLQDTDAPLIFMTDDDLADVAPGTLIVDVSCDEAMGFSWARPTTFADPTFVLGDNVLYYAVDHSPSYLWNSATWEISEALLPFVRTIMGGSAAWDADPTIRRAIEIRDGVIQNPAFFPSRAAPQSTRTCLWRNWSARRGSDQLVSGIQGRPSASMTRVSRKVQPCLAAVDR